MEEEIDLRPYIEALIKRWYWIVGLTFIAIVVAYVVSSFVPPVYEATALVAVIAPQDLVQFDPRIQGVRESQPLRAFPQLAVSDQILQALLEDDEVVEDVKTVEGLRGSLHAEGGDDISIIELKVTSQKPEQAAELANAWAVIFVDWANEVYTGRNSNQVRFFEEQLAESERTLSAADEALLAYQAINRTEVLSNTLNAQLNTQTIYLDAQQEVNFLIQDTQRLREQLDAQPHNNSITLADQLTALLLQLKVFNVNTPVPLQLQLIENSNLTINNRSEQIALLSQLLITLSAQAAQIDGDLARLEPHILDLQYQVQAAEIEYKQLLRDRVIARETYMVLARKVEEERITSSDMASGVRLASKATVPDNPTGGRKLFFVAIVATLIFFGALFGIVAREWWKLYQPLDGKSVENTRENISNPTIESPG